MRKLVFACSLAMVLSHAAMASEIAVKLTEAMIVRLDNAKGVARLVIDEPRTVEVAVLNGRAGLLIFTPQQVGRSTVRAYADDQTLRGEFTVSVNEERIETSTKQPDDRHSIRHHPGIDFDKPFFMAR